MSRLDVRSEKMRILAEHRAILVIALLHTGCVIYGILGTKAIINLREKGDWPVPAVSQFFASFGLILILVPITWLVLLEILERKGIDWSEGIAAISVAVFIVGSTSVTAILTLKAVAGAYF